MVEKVIISDTLTVENVKLESVEDNFYCKLFYSPEYAYGCGTFTYPRDGEKYKLACIGNQVWLAEKLRYAGAGVDYGNNQAYRSVYGRLYKKEEAMNGGKSATNPSGVRGICPAGWHIPSKAEWEELIENAGGANVARRTLRSIQGWYSDKTIPGTNDFGFNMKPSGKGDDEKGLFSEKDSAAYFWTATPSVRAPKTGYYMLLFWPSSIIIGEYGGDILPSTYKVQYACRCVKD